MGGPIFGSGDGPAAAEPAQDEVLPGSPRPRRAARHAPRQVGRAALVLIALAFGVGLLVGRASVSHEDAASAPPSSATGTSTPASSSAVPVGPATLQQTGARCSQQLGHKLVLGVELRNTATSPVIFKALHVQLPMGGLTVLSRGLGSCGELDVPNLKDMGLAPGGAVWISITARPREACPAAVPVKFSVDVTDASGTAFRVDVGGFNDLGDVPWSGCSSASR